MPTARRGRLRHLKSPRQHARARNCRPGKGIEYSVITKTNTGDSVARRLVAQVAAVAHDRPNRPWVLLAEIVNRLDVSWDEAELAAALAAAEGWIEYHAHSLLLRGLGRQMLEDDLLRKPRKRG
jgi:hypothetical protein